MYIQVSCDQIEQGETETANLEFPKWIQTAIFQSTGDKRTGSEGDIYKYLVWGPLQLQHTHYMHHGF